MNNKQTYILHSNPSIKELEDCIKDYKGKNKCKDVVVEMGYMKGFSFAMSISSNRVDKKES